jgi:hypothetical protein
MLLISMTDRIRVLAKRSGKIGEKAMVSLGRLAQLLVPTCSKSSPHDIDKSLSLINPRRRKFAVDVLILEIAGPIPSTDQKLHFS